MDSILCHVYTIENDEEVHVGLINVFTVPRVGEYLWFSKARREHTSWSVVDVCYHVGDGEGSIPYQSITIYVEPTEQDDELPTRLEGSD